MRTLFLWKLSFVLFITPYSLADWNIDTSPTNTNEIPILKYDDFATADSVNDGLTQIRNALPTVMDVGQVTAQSSDCAPNIKTSPGRKMRARSQRDMCLLNDDPSTNQQLRTDEQNHRNKNVLLTPFSGQKQPARGTGTGGPDPNPFTRFVPLYPEDEAIAEILLPPATRPKGDPDVCPYVGFSVPVCADGKYRWGPDGNLRPVIIILDVVTPYPATGCPIPLLTILYCCNRVAITYRSNTELELPFRADASPEETMGLLKYLPNPFRFTGLKCIEAPHPPSPRGDIPEQDGDSRRGF